MLNKIIAVIVLYNQKFSESSSVISLHRSAQKIGKRLSLYVYDNSFENHFDVRNSEFPFFNIDYVHNPLNPGVSKAYNECMKKYKKDKDWILILDQDSNFPSESLLKYLQAISNCQSAIYAPKVLDSNSHILVSPCRYVYKRGFHLSIKKINVGLISTKNVSIINSGALISTDALSKIGGFDENLFDYSDHEFFERIGNIYRQFCLIDLTINHDLSSGKNDNSKSTERRYIMLCSAAKYYSKKTKNIFPIFWTLLRGVKLTYLNRNINYLKIFFNNDWEQND